NRQMVVDEMNTTLAIIASVKARIEARRQESEWLYQTSDMFGGNTPDWVKGARDMLANPDDYSQLKTLDGLYSQIRNSLSEIDKTSYKVTQSNKDSTSATESSTKALSANERALRDVNQQIALNQKLQGRTDDDGEKLKLNNELIKLYQKQIKVYGDLKTELEANNKGITSL